MEFRRLLFRSEVAGAELCRLLLADARDLGGGGERVAVAEGLVVLLRGVDRDRGRAAGLVEAEVRHRIHALVPGRPNGGQPPAEDTRWGGGLAFVPGGGYAERGEGNEGVR